MDCRFDKDIIQKYVDNTIDPLEFIFLKEHLAYCSECKSELDLLMKIDEGFYGIFDKEFDCKGLEPMVEKIVENCLYELEKKHMLRFALKKAVEVSTNVVENTTKFANYLPGNKLVRKETKKAAAAASRLIKSTLKKEVKRLLTLGQ